MLAHPLTLGSARVARAPSSLSPTRWREGERVGRAKPDRVRGRANLIQFESVA